MSNSTCDVTPSSLDTKRLYIWYNNIFGTTVTVRTSIIIFGILNNSQYIYWFPKLSSVTLKAEAPWEDFRANVYKISASWKVDFQKKNQINEK